MSAPPVLPPRATEPRPQEPTPQPSRYKLPIGYCVVYAIPTFLGLLILIFFAIPALMPPEFRLDPSSTLSSHNISTSNVTTRWNISLSIKNPSQLIPVKYTHMKLILSFDSQLRLSPPSLIPTFTQGPGNVTTVRAKALSTLPVGNDLGVKCLRSALEGGIVAIDVVAEAKRKLHLGPWWVPVLDVYFSCMGATFTAPTDSKSGSDWKLGGTMNCIPDTFTILW